MTLHDFVDEFDKLRPDIPKHFFRSVKRECAIYGPSKGWGANVVLFGPNEDVLSPAGTIDRTQSDTFMLTFSLDTSPHVFDLGHFTSPREAAQALFDRITQEGF